MGIIEIVGDSMLPHLKNGNLLITKKLIKNRIKRWDIVTFILEEKLLVKRVVGLPGEVIELKDGKIFVNGNSTPFHFPELSEAETFSWKTSQSEIILLGDNLTDSLDSRKLGSINHELLISRVVFRIWPPKKI